MSKEKDKKEDYKDEEEYFEEEDIDNLNELLAQLAYQYKDELDEYIDEYVNNYKEEDNYEREVSEENDNTYYDEETKTQITDSPNCLVYEKYDLKDSELPYENNEDDYYELFEEIYKREKYLKSITDGEEDTKQFSIFFKFHSTNYCQTYWITSSNPKDDKVMITKKRIRKINNN